MIRCTLAAALRAASSGPLPHAAAVGRGRTFAAEGVHQRAPPQFGTPKAASGACGKCGIRCAASSMRTGAFSEYLVHQVLRLMIERCEAAQPLSARFAAASSSRTWSG